MLTTTSRQPQTVKARCQFCRRVLTDSQSIARGTGPECAEKLARMLAAVDAGRAIETTIGDYKLFTLGAKLRQMLRLETVNPTSKKLQADLHTARMNYARRVEYLASQGMLTIPEPEPTGASVAPTDSEMTAMAQSEPTIERRELRVGGKVERLPLTEAVIVIQNESFFAANNRRYMKDIVRRLRAGQPYTSGYSDYQAVP
jgi:hypothetical protein